MQYIFPFSRYTDLWYFLHDVASVTLPQLLVEQHRPQNMKTSTECHGLGFICIIYFVASDLGEEIFVIVKSGVHKMAQIYLTMPFFID